MTIESKSRAQQQVEDWHRWHQEQHHRIQVKAYSLYEEMRAVHGVDYGDQYWWYLARFQLGMGPEPFTPPVE